MFANLLESDIERLHILITRHAKLTGSKRAAEILADWKTWLPKFRKVMPVEYRRALKELKAVAVMDRSDSMNGQEGPLCLEVKAALFDKGLNKILVNYIYGLGGREIKLEELEGIYKSLFDALKGARIDKVNYLGVRE